MFILILCHDCLKMLSGSEQEEREELLIMHSLVVIIKTLNLLTCKQVFSVKHVA